MLWKARSECPLESKLEGRSRRKSGCRETREARCEQRCRVASVGREHLRSMLEQGEAFSATCENPWSSNCRDENYLEGG